MIIFPLVPINPGFSMTPSNETVPVLLENDGSLTHIGRMELCLEREIISSLSLENEMVPAAAFIGWSVLTYKLTDRVSPTVYSPDEG